MADTRDIEALFRLPLTEFTSARNALAARLTKAGRSDQAAQVKALTRPPLSAWTVNQLFWRHRETFDRLLAAGNRLRQAQASQLRGKGGDLREAIEARRVALAELTQQATVIVREGGHAVSPDVLRRVTGSLDALATLAGDASSPMPGQLTNDVAPPGFAALSALVPRTGSAGHSPTSRQVLSFPTSAASKPAATRDPAVERRKQEAQRRAQRAAAEAAVRSAERALAAARKTAAAAQADLRKAASRVREAERVKARLAAQMEKTVEEADRARDQARRVAASAEHAAQAVEDAERALDHARRRQADLA